MPVPSKLPSFSDTTADATTDVAARWLELLMRGGARKQERQGANSPWEGARRPALRALGMIVAAVVGALLASRMPSWDAVFADHSTGTGEQRDLLLEDGSLVKLNTRTTVNVRFDARQRLLQLLDGEVWIVMADKRTPDPRPFVVETAQGEVRAQGTRFTVRQADDCTHLAVDEGALEITPRMQPNRKRLLGAGEVSAFTASFTGSPGPTTGQSFAWTRGLIVVDDMPLGVFLAELSRYRQGVLRCDPAVADLRISGVFPLADTGRILRSLPAVLPVAIASHTRYWVTVTTRTARHGRL